MPKSSSTLIINSTVSKPMVFHPRPGHIRFSRGFDVMWELLLKNFKIDPTYCGVVVLVGKQIGNDHFQKIITRFLFTT